MQFPDFHEFEAYLRAVEPELIQLASRGKVYQLKSKDPASISAFASDMATQTLAAANDMAMGYLAACHQFLADYFDGLESD